MTPRETELIERLGNAINAIETAPGDERELYKDCLDVILLMDGRLSETQDAWDVVAEQRIELEKLRKKMFDGLYGK